MSIKRIGLFIHFMLLFTSILSTSTQALSPKKENDIVQRISAPGSVCLEGDTCSQNVVTTSTDKGPRTGKQIYNTNCTACHSTGAAGAPIKGNAAQWKQRLAKGKDALYNSVINGIGAMPAKGLCMDCSVEEIKATVDYIIQ